MASLAATGIIFGGVFFLHLGSRLHQLSPTAKSSVLFVLAEAGAILAVVSLVSWLMRLPAFTQRLDGVLLPVGTFGYANAFAAFLILTIAATTALFAHLRSLSPTERSGIEQGLSGHPRVFLVALLSPQLLALVLTRAKAVAGIAALLLLIVLVMQTRRSGVVRRRRYWLRVSLMAVVALALVGGAVVVWREVAPQMAVSGLPIAETDPQTGDPLRTIPMTSDAFRIKTWMAALQASRDRPWWGYGLDTFLPAYLPFKLGAHTAYAHNLMVQQAVELGVAGVILLAAFLILVFARPVRLLGGSVADPRFALTLGLLAFVLHNLVDLSWYFPALLMIFMLLAGMLLSWEETWPRVPSTRRLSPP